MKARKRESQRPPLHRKSKMLYWPGGPGYTTPPEWIRIVGWGPSGLFALEAGPPCGHALFGWQQTAGAAGATCRREGRQG